MVKPGLRFTLMPDAYSTKTISPSESVFIVVPSGIACSLAMPLSGRSCLNFGAANVVMEATEFSMRNTESLSKRRELLVECFGWDTFRLGTICDSTITKSPPKSIFSIFFQKVFKTTRLAAKKSQKLRFGFATRLWTDISRRSKFPSLQQTASLTAMRRPDPYSYLWRRNKRQAA